LVLPAVEPVPRSYAFVDWRRWLGAHYQYIWFDRIRALAGAVRESQFLALGDEGEEAEEAGWDAYKASLHPDSPFLPSRDYLTYFYAEAMLKVLVTVVHYAFAAGAPIVAAALNTIAFGAFVR
jgi:hypothetical protein